MPETIPTTVVLVCISVTGLFNSLVWSFNVYRQKDGSRSMSIWSRPRKLWYPAISLSVLILIFLSLASYISAGPSDAWYLLLCLIIRLNSLNQILPAIFLFLGEPPSLKRFSILTVYCLVTQVPPVFLAGWLPLQGQDDLRTVLTWICTELDPIIAFLVVRWKCSIYHSTYLKWTVIQIIATTFMLIGFIVAFYENEKHQDIIFAVLVLSLLVFPGWGFISCFRSSSSANNDNERNIVNDAASERYLTGDTTGNAFALADMPPENSSIQSQKSPPHKSIHSQTPRRSTSITFGSSTQSVAPETYNYEIFHDRTYHAFKSGKYLLPNDTAEIERMDTLDIAFNIVLGGECYMAPVEDPRQILDVGTGTGKWCIRVAEENPSCNVTGIDLSPIQPDTVPLNCQFQVADADDELNFGIRFDLIHTRNMHDYTLNSWSTFFRQAYFYLQPGGWLEMHEIGLHSSYHSDIPSDSPFKLWQREWQKAFNMIGLAGYCEPTKVMYEMEEAGFKHVTCETFQLPIGVWPEDERLKRAGIFGQMQLVDGLSGMSYKPFMNVLSYDRNRLEELLVKCKEDIEREHVRRYQPLFVVVGQKPQA